jgi:hypothetical protein
MFIKLTNIYHQTQTMINKYWAPTPKKWRKIGDGLLASATVIAVGGIWQFDALKELFTTPQLRTMIISSIVLGVVGKFLTNFFKED